MSCSHRSALCSPAGGSLYLSVVVWIDPSGCIDARFVHVNSWVPITYSMSISSLEDRAITNIPAKRKRHVLSPSFRLISFADVIQHIWVFFFKFTYRLIILQIDPSHVYVLLDNQRRIIFCKGFPQAMMQFGGLGLGGSIEVSVIVIVTVRHLLGSSQCKVMVRVRLGLGL